MSGLRLVWGSISAGIVINSSRKSGELLLISEGIIPRTLAGLRSDASSPACGAAAGSWIKEP